MRRGTLAAFVAIATAFTLGCGEQQAPAGSACRVARVPGVARAVIVVLIDTLRADHVGLYSGVGLTPRLDAFGARSLVFRRAYATSSWTRPSVGSMFTGLYPGSLGLNGRFDALPPSVPTLAELLQREGVATFGISTNGNAGSQWGFARGFDSWSFPKERRSYPGGTEVVPAEVVTREALEALDLLLTGSPDGRFFGFVHYIDPHDPYLPHAPEGSAVPAAEAATTGLDGSRRMLERLDAQRDRTAADEEKVRGLYRGEVRYVDAWVGALLDGLSERGVLEESLIIVTSDHGEGLFDHDRRGHGGKLYEEQIRIPLLIKPPARAGASASARDDFASLVDLVPTTLAAFGLPPVADLPGHDLLACPVSGEQQDRAVHAEIRDHGRYYEALRESQWKLIRNRAAAPENRGRVVPVLADDTVWKIAWRYFGGDEALESLLEVNPSRFPAGTQPEHTKLIPGELLRLPDGVRPPGVPELELFDLSRDPMEREAVVDVASPQIGRVLETLEAEREEIARRAVPGLTVTEPLPEELIDELRGLGYLD